MKIEKDKINTISTKRKNRGSSRMRLEEKKNYRTKKIYRKLETKQQVKGQSQIAALYLMKVKH